MPIVFYSQKRDPAQLLCTDAADLPATVFSLNYDFIHQAQQTESKESLTPTGSRSSNTFCCLKYFMEVVGLKTLSVTNEPNYHSSNESCTSMTVVS